MHCQLLIVLDAGKTEHHATAPLPDGMIVRNKPLTQSEAQLSEFFTELPAQHGQGLLVVDQPNTISALPVAAAQSLDLQVATCWADHAARRGPAPKTAENRCQGHVHHRRHRPGPCRTPCATSQ